jgi:hypothetical protein
MATLEATKGRSTSSHEEHRGQTRSRSASLLDDSLTPTRIDANLYTPFLPSVPTYDPRRNSKMSETEAERTDGGHGETQEGVEDSAGEADFEKEEAEEEEIEEVMEELQDDEIEEMVNEEGRSFDSYTQIVGQELETMPLLIAAQSICVGTMQSLVRSVLANFNQESTVGSREVVDNLIKASDAIAVAVTAPASSVSLRLVDNQPDNGAFQTLNLVLKQVQIGSTGLEADVVDDADLLLSLNDVMAEIQTAKATLDNVESPLRNDLGEPTSPIPTIVSPNIKETTTAAAAVATTTTAQQQQSRGQRGYGFGRTNTGGSLSLHVGANPSTSREEFRNPFSDFAARPQSALSDDRWRERTDRELENSMKIVKVLEYIETRCGEVIESLSVQAEGEERVDSANSKNGKNAKQWKQLQQVCKAARDRFASRRTSASPTLPKLDMRRGSGSPTPYSPTYSPSRGRSRRSSAASMNSVIATSSLNNFDMNGESTGEAIAAGVGIGAQRSLSRLSNHSVRSGSNAGLGSSSNPFMGTLLARRESAKSEISPSYSAQFPPPCYSEDSMRNGSYAAWSVADMNRESDAASGMMEGRRRQSSGDQSVFSTRTLPAYIASTNDATHGAVADKKDSSASLAKPDSDGVGHQTSVGTDLTHQQDFHALSAHHARTSQDLTVLKASIDRLYSAVPQLDDQRALSPVDAKERQAQKQDEMLELIEKLANGGRIGEGSSGGSMNGRLAKKLGSISFPYISLRRANSALGTEGKGKEKEKRDAGEQGSSTRSGPEDASSLTNEAHVSRERGLRDQRSPTSKKPSKVESMGFGDPSTRMEDDDDMFDMLSASLSSSRMADQDALKRPTGAGTASPPVSAVRESGSSSSPMISPGPEARAEHAALNSSPPNLSVGKWR